MTAPMHAFAAELGLDPKVFENSACFITAVRTGVSGKVLQQALAQFENRQLFAGALNTDLEGLKEYGSATRLNAQQSESLLDSLRILGAVRAVWGSHELAEQWLDSPVQALGGEKPVDLFDSYEGRQWVAQVAKKIELGDFS